jgi:hypothetical protein
MASVETYEDSDVEEMINKKIKYAGIIDEDGNYNSFEEEKEYSQAFSKDQIVFFLEGSD